MFKVALHQVKIVFIVLMIHSGVLPDEDTELVERLGYFEAFLMRFVFVVAQEGGDIDDWYFRKLFHGVYLIDYICNAYVSFNTYR